MPKKKILLFSRDPGGADTIMPLVMPLEKRGFHVHLYGKDFALKKYSDSGLCGTDIVSLIGHINQEKIRKFIKEENPDALITGTSADDFTEKYIWRSAEELGVKSFAVLDQWSNYGIRFSTYGMNDSGKFEQDRRLTYLPGKICVMDDHAKQEMIKEGFPTDRLVVTGQPHFEWLIEKMMTPSSQATKRIELFGECDRAFTFVSEPFSSVYGSDEKAIDALGYNERSVAENVTSSVARAVKEYSLNVSLIIRLHPKEDKGKYDDLAEKLYNTRGLKITIDSASNSFDIICVSDAVIGMTSMMLIEAAVVGKAVLSVQTDLKGDDKFKLAKIKACMSAVDKFTLDNAIDLLIKGRFNSQPRFDVINDPISRIIGIVENTICRN